LAQAAKLRDDVERIMQHDLKNPLNAIIHAPSILAPALQNNHDTESEKNFKILKMIETAGYTMLKMINSSLDLYKMETGVYSLKAEPVDILSVLRSVLHEITASSRSGGRQGVIRMQGREVKREDRLWAEAEEMLCYPMFSNLLNNAFEASPCEVNVEIDLEQDDGCVHVLITNSGAVSESIRADFFEKYITSGKDWGTGLGTYSARLCAETQNGSIGMEILEEEQTRITVTLPASIGTT
jgi:signal transduction histidine kinase